LSTDYQPVARNYCPHGLETIAEAEKRAFGVTHGQVSAMILQYWHLPDMVCDAVRWHAEEPPSWNTSSMHLARIVGAADRISKYLCETPQDVDAVAGACQAIMAGLELEPVVLARILTEIEPQIEDFASVLRVDVIPSQICAMIADKVRGQLAAPV
jgi:HD-like signal output (HDOD) protein